MLVLDGKTDLNQISLTGVRAITLIGLLSVEPRTFDEIREKFIKFKILDESHSDDILRIDLNTVKAIGCEISRPSRKNKFKYVLSKHPFTLYLDNNDAVILKKVMEKFKSTTNIPLLVEYDALLRKIANYVYDDDVKEAIIGASPLVHYCSDIVKDLIVDCNYNNTLTLFYKKPTNKSPTEKVLIAKKLVFISNKLYLQCYDLNKKAPVVLNIKNITEIVSRSLTKNKIETDKFKIKFLIKNFKPEILDEDEIILDEKENQAQIEGSYFNEFYAMQRVLSLGSSCTVIEPIEFRNFIISKLKEMRKLYD
ncbi:MAG: WYL domain-containing protein [bacterium]|nr:WYL domain-containing protein [bacterium]